jgi:AraC-like DNA-binding protein
VKLFIRNMVCDRCRFAIRDTLDGMGIPYESISLGEANLGKQELDEAQLREFRQKVESLGFELINDRKSRLIESIKTTIITYLQELAGPDKPKLSKFLSDRLFHDYTYLSNLFSSVEGVTIEQYFIAQRIEKVKELLVYDELSLTEIAYRLGFSSTSHLSRQFRKITGLTPTKFKSLRNSDLRRPLDKT